jgi:hypothetical protein
VDLVPIDASHARVMLTSNGELLHATEPGPQTELGAKMLGDAIALAVRRTARRGRRTLEPSPPEFQALAIGERPTTAASRRRVRAVKTKSSLCVSYSLAIQRSTRDGAGAPIDD